MNRKQIRLNESQLNRIVKESIKKVLMENYDYEDEQDTEYQGYYYSISSCDEEFTPLSCFEEEGGFDSPEEAYNEGLKQLEYYNDDRYILEVFHFIPQYDGKYINHVGDFDNDYMAVNDHGKIREY